MSTTSVTSLVEVQRSGPPDPGRCTKSRHFKVPSLFAFKFSPKKKLESQRRGARLLAPRGRAAQLQHLPHTFLTVKAKVVYHLSLKSRLYRMHIIATANILRPEKSRCLRNLSIVNAVHFEKRPKLTASFLQLRSWPPRPPTDNKTPTTSFLLTVHTYANMAETQLTHEPMTTILEAPALLRWKEIQGLMERHLGRLFHEDYNLMFRIAQGTNTPNLLLLELEFPVKFGTKFGPTVKVFHLVLPAEQIRLQSAVLPVADLPGQTYLYAEMAPATEARVIHVRLRLTKHGKTVMPVIHRTSGLFDDTAAGLMSALQSVSKATDVDVYLSYNPKAEQTLLDLVSTLASTPSKTPTLDMEHAYDGSKVRLRNHLVKILQYAWVVDEEAHCTLAPSLFAMGHHARNGLEEKFEAVRRASLQLLVKKISGATTTTQILNYRFVRPLFGSKNISLAIRTSDSWELLPSSEEMQ
ncbi:hypothetical protein K490DRAFT_58347 [Saccharata proteae CBS 121410]|uniref:Uncharacterized protein n=1 Tax=Saccharata proteae CBS 121410 TaxID=1314787 RepID=A0A9P4HSM5_9PEZI|nr:hypothetical protein K490DRAFT_58347 [Saccharata proteae CBS 121410]